MILDKPELELVVETLEEAIAKLNPESEAAQRLVDVVTKLDASKLRVPHDAPQSPEILRSLMQHLQGISEFVLDADITSYAFAFSTLSNGDNPEYGHYGLTWITCAGLEASHAVVLSRLIANSSQTKAVNSREN